MNGVKSVCEVRLEVWCDEGRKEREGEEERRSGEENGMGTESKDVEMRMKGIDSGGGVLKTDNLNFAGYCLIVRMSIVSRTRIQR